MKILLLSLTPFLLLADLLLIDTAKILQTHNALRSKHFNAPLVYSKHLEDESKKWALHLAKNNGCKMKHSSDEYGENLYWASASIRKSKKSTDKDWVIHKSPQKVSLSRPIQAWYDEIEFYNYKTNSCQEGKICGHYTQLVWKKTKEVGCAAYICNNFSQVWVCKYSPAGNYIGQRPY